MPEEQTVQASQEGAESQVQEATSEAREESTSTESTQEQQSDTNVGQEPTSIEELPEWVQKEIKALRKENAKARTERQKEADAKKTDLQTKDERIAEVEAENETLTRQVRRSAFIETIALPNPRAAWGYVLDGTVEVEYDEYNRPKNLDAIRKSLKQEDAALFGNGSADGGASSAGNAGYQGAPGYGRLLDAYSNNKT